jgi:phage-related protein
MSANEYMENVTSFSASLISGLNGDTAKASKIADQAIRDMSDNANTFGTDIGMLQNAYQGFAKGNFTMLDNLKLGYGGTKEEMLRLVKDAGVVDESVKSIDDVSFDQIIEAIHIVQDNMNITGTTAQEASATIQGSTASMKSAWQNMLTGMADENSNFEELATNFVSTLITEDGQGGVLGNLIPRISQVITGMSNAIQSTLPMLIKQVVPLIQENIPVIMSAVQDALKTILSVLPEVIPIVADLIPQIVQSLITLLPDIIDAGIQIILGLIQGISEAIPQLIQMLPTVIKQIVDVLINNVPMIITVGVELLLGLIDGLTEAIPQLIDYIPQIVETIVTVLIENLPMIIDSAVKIIVALANGLMQSLPKLIAVIPRIITTIASTLIKNLPQIIQGGVKIIASLIKGMLQNMGNVATAIKKVGTAILNGIKSFPSKMLSVGKNIVKGIWEGITGSLSWIKGKIKGWVGNVTKFIKGLFGIKSPSKLFRDEIGANLALGIGEGFSDEMRYVATEMGDSIPKSFDIDTSINGSGLGHASIAGASFSNDMVNAFKEALTQVKIVLDDEVAGEFVDKTVTRMIYT